MHNTSHALLGKTVPIILGFVVTTLAGCIDNPFQPLGRTRDFPGNGFNHSHASHYGYGYAGANRNANYRYYPRYGTYYDPQSRHFYCQEGDSWQVRASPYGVSSRALFASPYVPLHLEGHPSNHHSRVAQSYPSNWSPPGRHGNSHLSNW